MKRLLKTPPRFRGAKTGRNQRGLVDDIWEKWSNYILLEDGLIYCYIYYVNSNINMSHGVSGYERTGKLGGSDGDFTSQ